MLHSTNEAAVAHEVDGDAALERALDAALADSFPASDPVAVTRRVRTAGAAPRRTLVTAAVAATVVATSFSAGRLQAQGLTSPRTPAVDAPFDIVRTEVLNAGGEVVFKVRVRGKAGELRPKPTGQFAGSAVYSYVWPTTLDSAQVGFEAGQGILALAVTLHPDFDDAAYGGVNRHAGIHTGWS